MNQNDGNQNYPNSRKVQKKKNTEDEENSASNTQKSGSFQKETETREIVRRDLDSFNDFQKSTVNNGENDKLRTDASYDHTSVIGRSPTSCAPGNLPPDISKRRIHRMTEHHSKLVNELRMRMARNRREVGEGIEQEPSSNNASVEISDKNDSRITAEDKESFASHTQKSGDFQKETETCEIERRALGSFNVLQIRNVNNGESGKLLTDASYDHTSVIGRSSTSCAPGLNLPLDVSKPRVQGMTENNNKDANEIRIVSTRSLSTTESSTSACTTDLKCENSLSSNGGFNRDEIRYAVLKEDDDWDIYQPGMVHDTESSLESRFSFENAILQNERHVSKNNSVSSVDSDSCQRSTPYAGRKTNNSQSSNLSNNGGTFLEWNEERILKEVKLFFLVNPPRQTNRLTELESMMRIITSPYFSSKFALKHGLPLPPSPVFTPFQQMNVKTEQELFEKAYSLLNNAGITRRHFTSYISLWKYGRPGERIPEEWSERSGLSPSVIQHLNIILELVGSEVLIDIYELLTAGDPEMSRIFRDEKSSYINQMWDTQQNCQELYGIYPFWDQKETYGFGDNCTIITEDFPSTSSNFHVSNTPCLNASDSNSFSNADDMKAKREMWKTNQSPMNLPEMQSMKSYDISETGSKRRPFILQSSNPDEGNRSSFDSLHGYSNKTNELPDPTPTILPLYRNSNDQNDEEISRKRHSVKSKDSKNNAPHSSFQNSGEDQSDQDKAFKMKALQDILNARTRVRKHIEDDISETDSKKHPTILQSSNPDEGNRRSFDSIQGHSNKTNDSPDPTPTILPLNRNALDQNDEEILRKRHTVKSKDSKNNALHSSFQNSAEDQPNQDKTFQVKVLGDSLNARSRVRKHIKDDDSKSRKRIRLQENSSTDQPENQENTPTKDQSENPPKNFWPRPRTKSCIIM